MVGIVLVSHSRALAVAVRDLVQSLTGGKLALAIAAGVGDERRELGTDAVEISEAIASVQGPDGVLVFMDMGSAILSAETALELMDESARVGVAFCSAPFVEGAVAAGVTAHFGSPLEQVRAEAARSLQAKQNALGESAQAPASLPAPAPAKMPSDAKTLQLLVRNLHGLHARPAARLLAEMKDFSSRLTIKNLANGRGPIPLNSLSALAGLEILRDHEIEISAAGSDAEIALARIKDLIESGMGEELPTKESPATAAKTELPSSPMPAPGPTPVSAGLALGEAFYLEATKFVIPPEKTADVPGEKSRLQRAVDSVQVSLEKRRDQVRRQGGAHSAEIFEAQMLALQDPELLTAALARVADQRENALQAWWEAKEKVRSRYAALADPYLRERGADYEDVAGQVLTELGAGVAEVDYPPGPCILVADDLTPRQVSGLDPTKILGVVLRHGGPTAHSSILLRALAIPTLVQAQAGLAQAASKRPAVIGFDGESGELWLDPAPAEVAKIRQRQTILRREADQQRKAAQRPGETADGHRIHVVANIGSVADAARALEAGAEGVGLLRTEFLFLERTIAPTEAEQAQVLSEIILRMAPRPVVIRTLDIGGDKIVPYLHLPKEENPFLGVRALRLCFAHLDLFSTQLRAILRAALGGECRIMFPMVADANDLSQALEALRQAHLDLERENIPHAWPIPAGVMVEIPSAALLAGQLAEQAEFFSIGTNDLTQYALAADRGNPALAAYQDPAHPAVLRLVREVVAGAQKYYRPVAVCGEAAADECAAAILVGLGVRELSVSAPAIPRIKAMLRRYPLSALEELAERALNCENASAVRELVKTL